MLDTKLFTAFIVLILIITLVAENEVDATPEPCRELFGLFNKPEKLRKPKENKQDVPDDSEKSKKTKKKQLQKLEKVLEALMHWEQYHKKEKVETAPSKGALQQLVDSYINFLSYLIQF